MQHKVADYEAYATDHAVGALVRGRVRAVAPFGVFVELAPNVEGLLEIPHFASVPDATRFPTGYPQVGTLVEATIMYFNVPTMNIRLTQRGPESAA
jgi:small subunit ribosomal protein S1